MYLTPPTEYSVWHDTQEPWNPDHIPPPDLQCTARNEVAAAEKLADAGDFSYGAFIVRNEETWTYRQIELVRGWAVKQSRSTTLAELEKR